jgi:hypothetical protein
MKVMNNMQKLLIIFVAVFALIGISPAQATSEESIVIIDVNFESQLIDGRVTEVCITSAYFCNSSPTPKRASEFQAFNHGTIMADIARSKNPSAHLILLESGIGKTGVVTGNELLLALNWVVANASQNNVRAVSFSYNSGDGSKCTPKSPGVKVQTVHANIVKAIATLKNVGVKFYASTGNHSKTAIDYPACIPDAIAVGSTDFAGSVQLSDIVLSGPVYSSAKLRSVRTAINGLHSSFPITTTDANPVMVGFTTSVATIIAAATNK